MLSTDPTDLECGVTVDPRRVWRDMTAFDAFTPDGKRIGRCLRGNGYLVNVQQGEGYRAVPRGNVQLVKTR